VSSNAPIRGSLTTINRQNDRDHDFRRRPSISLLSELIYMKKVIVPFEGANYPEDSLKLARRLNILSSILLTAAFVPEVDYAQYGALPNGMASPIAMPGMSDDDAAILKNNALVEEYCEAHAIPYTIHTDRFDYALSAIRKETRYADLLLLSSRHFFENIDKEQPNTYMKEILHTAECPILMVPESPCLPGHLILAYDGSPASVYAIRQFSYLFHELCDTPATLVYLNNKTFNERETIPEEKFMEELLSQHFNSPRVLRLRMSTDEFYHTWLADKPNAWLISGAYGRSVLSQVFARSFASYAIKEHKLTMFIAHT
jgi:hypothetical protein